jgi:transcription elongation factor GreA
MKERNEHDDGLIVTVRDLEFKENLEYLIVGPAEADAFETKISYESPVGKALMGRTVGDIVDVAAPAGIIQYEILEIKVQRNYSVFT